MDSVAVRLGPVSKGTDPLIVIYPVDRAELVAQAVTKGILAPSLKELVQKGPRVKVSGSLSLLTGNGTRQVLVAAVNTPVPRTLSAGSPQANGGPGECLRAVLTGRTAQLERFRQVGAEISNYLRNQTLTAVDIAVLSTDGARAAGAVVEGLKLSSYAYNRYHAVRRGQATTRKIRVNGLGDKAELQAQVERADLVAESVWLARDLTNTPANDLGPVELEKAARDLAKALKLPVKSMGPAELKKQGMGAILGVARGSRREPRLIILEHSPRGAARKVVLIGKGVTFDSGGLSLKDPKSMELMKKDMAGAAASLGAMRVVASLKIPVHLVVIIPAVENMPDGDAQRPGDIVTSAAGKTIEVMNTDAEGRLILADALTYARGLKPDLILDIATLTGEAGRTFGNVVSPVLGNDWSTIEQVVVAGEATHERVWPLPILDEYRDAMNGDLGDLRNSSTIGGLTAGSILGASFLAEFAGDTPWVHLDVANTSWVASDTGYLKKGATGMGVRLLSRFIEDWAQAPAKPARKRARK